MIYLANPVGPAALTAMTAGLIGFIDTPLQGNIRPAGVTWCADNGCFSDKWDAVTWWRFLVKHAPAASSCLFATAPDVVGDAAATLARSTPWLARMRDLGYKVAYVAQNGQEDVPLPWDDFDVLFIGGDDPFKLGPFVRTLVADAKARGKWVHMGRVNSFKRWRYADAIGCDSVDGTALVYDPVGRLAEVLAWTRNNDQHALF